MGPSWGGGGGGTVRGQREGLHANLCTSLPEFTVEFMLEHSPSAPADLLLPAYMPEGDRKGTQAPSPGTPRGPHCLRDTVLESYSLRVGTAHTHPNTLMSLDSCVPVHTQTLMNT